jgi:hypothetical protein
VSGTRASVEMSWWRLVAGDEAVAVIMWRNCRSRVRGYLASGRFLKVTAEMCAGKFPLVSMGGQAEGLAREVPGARTPIGPR